MGLSIHTNIGATVALQSLNRTNRELDVLQKRVSTGFRVSDAKDDGAAFAVAQGLRNQISSYESFSQRLAEGGQRILKVTETAMKTISDITGNVGAVLIKLSDNSLSAEERTTYNKEYSNLVDEIRRTGLQATVNGINLLDQAGNFNFFIGATATGTQVVSGMYLIHSTFLYGNLSTVTTANDAKNLLAPGGGYQLYKALVSDNTAKLGGYLASYERQINFSNVVTDTMRDALGVMVDADLAKDSARMQSLQIRQQLGAQTLSIANQSPSVILQLFK